MYYISNTYSKSYWPSNSNHDKHSAKVKFIFRPQLEVYTGLKEKGAVTQGHI